MYLSKPALPPLSEFNDIFAWYCGALRTAYRLTWRWWTVSTENNLSSNIQI